MKYQDRFKEIADFLKPYQRIWENEIMLLYPNPLSDYNSQWIEELSQIKDEKDVIRLEMKDYHGLIHSPTLINFYQEIEHLCRVNTPPTTELFPSERLSFLYIIPKKEHEIRQLAPLVNNYYQAHKINKIIDIGGGVGHLAQSISNHYNIKSISLDMDEALQKRGQAIHTKKAGKGQQEVEYHQVKVDPENSKFKALLEPEDMTIGLHTCGALANYQMMASAQSQIKFIINFGCCYHKMFYQENSQNISAYSKTLESQITLNNFALTLSTRAHKKMNEKDYQLKLKVKFFRYAFHILLHDHYDIKELVGLGNSSPRLYEENFSTYALEQFTRLKLKPKHSSKELDLFFQEPRVQELIWKMLSAGLIRNALGRLLELYILLDRVCYLEEQGYQCELHEVFNETVSPRNLGIFALRKT